MSSKIKVILVDDHELVRTSFRLLLELNCEFEVLCECSDEISFKKALEVYSPNVVLMDIKLQGVSGIELCKYASEFYPSIKVLFTSANADEHNIQLAIKAGCKGFVSKSSSSSELVEAILQVNNGKKYFSKDIADVMVQLFSEGYADQGNQKKLSIREIEIIRLLCDGKDFNSIGNELSISPRTVESHKKNILTKLHLNNTIELVKFAIREHIIEG
jgi:DNA-binding NarL/FixJ family response regulator